MRRNAGWASNDELNRLEVEAQTRRQQENAIGMPQTCLLILLVDF